MPHNLVSLKPSGVQRCIEITLTRNYFSYKTGRRRHKSHAFAQMCVFAHTENNEFLMKKLSMLFEACDHWCEWAMCNFQKVGFWVQVRIWRFITCGETTNYLLIDTYMLSNIFTPFIVMTSLVAWPEQTKLLKSLENITRISFSGSFWAKLLFFFKCY